MSEGGSAPDVFVAKIASATDHNYSLVVHNEPEVEIETIVDTTIAYHSNENNVIPIANPSGSGLIGLLDNLNVGESSSSLSTVLEDNGASDIAKNLEMAISSKKPVIVASCPPIPNVEPLSKYYQQHTSIIAVVNFLYPFITL